MSRNSRYTSIPDLSERMIAVGATNETLALAAGVGYSTISMHRAGKRQLSQFTASLILEALATRKFERRRHLVRPEKAEIIALKKRIAELERPKSQLDPIPNSNVAVWDLVLEDMKARDMAGLKKYGTRLQPYNGRRFLQDAYEEALDLAVYLRGAIYEQEGK